MKKMDEEPTTEPEDPEDKVITSDDSSLRQLERRLLRQKRTVLFLGYIEDVKIRDFLEDFEIMMLTSKEPITMLLSSSGGNVEAGLACIGAIRKAQREGIKVIGRVYGRAMSIAFLIFQFCNERVMGSADVLMAHGITSFSAGDMRNFAAEQKLLAFWQEYFAKFLARRVTPPAKAKSQDVRHWKKVLEDQTPQFYDSEECLELGLVDRVED